MKKLLGALVALLAFGAIGTFIVVQARHIGYNQGYQPDQPIAFSHKLHAGDLKMDCKYCHFAADKGRHAGIPPTELCLNCHKNVKKNSPEIRKIHEAVASGENVQWNRVNFFPDYAYFNHAQHVNVAELDCQKCHGPVEEMEIYYQHEKLNMGWCIGCHREKGIAPPNDHYDTDYHKYDNSHPYEVKPRLTGGDCSKCHY
jgi:hypothetical protein